jgi:4-amino-4-deoxy-L-arabinose transferase-like glycosyltransferase
MHSVEALVARASQRAHTRSLQSILVALPLLFTLGIFLLYLITYFAYAYNLFKFPFDYDQGEGFELYDAIRLARGENIYLDNAQFPFYASNYPPVYRVMLIPFVWLFGPKLYVARAVAFACSLVIGVFIFLAARKQFNDWRLETGDWIRSIANRQSLISLICALAFFAANYVYHVGPLARAHLPMVMFAVAGIYCLDIAMSHARRPESDKTLITHHSSLIAFLGILLLMTAAFTKLQAVDALAAGFGFLLLRNPKWFLMAFAGCLGFTLLFLLVMDKATAGQFWLNVVSANVNEYDIEVTWRTYYQWFALHGALISCSVVYVMWDVVAAIRARSFQPITVWSLYFVAGSALGMLTGKWGAGPTYLIAAIAASCVCTAGLFARIGRLEIRDWRLHTGNLQYLISNLLFVAIMLIQARSNIHLPVTGRFFGPLAQWAGVANEKSVYPPYPYYDTIGYTQLGHFVDAADIASGWDLVNTIANVPGPVWSEEAMLTLWAGKDVVTNPTQLLNLSKNNALDTTRMIEMIRAKRFGAVVFRAQFYPKDVKQAIVQNYYWAKMVRMNGFEYWVLLPNRD